MPARFTHYELWHVPSGNIVDTYVSEDDALDYVRRVLRAYGRDRAEELLLGAENARGVSRQIATGSALVERAVAAGSADPESGWRTA